MRTMLLSLRTDVYENVLAGKKIYEHRKVFPNEPILAYLYISSPKKAITGKMILKNKVSLGSWKEKYKYDLKTIHRIESYMENYCYAMEIAEFQETTEISLNELRNNLDKFIVPQMYYFIDDTPLLGYLESNLNNKEKHIINNFDNITSDMICLH